MEKSIEQEKVNKNLKLIAKSSLVVFIGVILSKILTILYRVVVGRHFGPEVYGVFSLVLMIEGFILAISLLGLSQGLLRQIALYRGEKQKDKIKYLFKKASKVLIISSIISAFLLFFLSDFIALQIFNNNELAFFLKIFSFVIPVLIFLEILAGIIRAYEKINQYSIIWNIFQSMVKFFLLGLFIILGLSSNAVVFSYILGIAATFLVAFLYCKYKLPEIFGKYYLEKQIKKKISKKLFSYSWPIIFMSLMGGIFYWIDSFLIGYFKGVFEVGIYNAAVPIATLFIITSPLFLNLFFPLMVKEYANKNFEIIKETSKQIGKWILTINFPVLILMLLFPGAIINLFFGEEFFLAANALRFLAIGGIITSIFLVSHNLILMVGKSRTLLWAIIISSILNFLLNFWLIPKQSIFGIENSLGVNGAALATMISMIAYNLILMFQAKHYTSIFPLRRKMLKIVLATIVPMLILIFLRQLFPITLASAILFGIFFLLTYVLFVFITGCLDKNDLMIIKTIQQRFKKK